MDSKSEIRESASCESAQRELLKSTGIIGSSQLLIMALNVVKTKIFSYLLGAEGIGLIGLYTSLLDLVRSFSSLGIHISGVRYIAEKNKEGEEQGRDRMIGVFRRWTWFSAFLGAFICFFGALPLSRYVFGSESHAVGIRVLSIALFLTALSGGQTAILQALRQVTSLALTNLCAAFASFGISVALAWYFGMEGIVPILLSFSVLLFCSGWYFVRQAYRESSEVRFTLREVLTEGIPMVRLGFLTILTGIATTGSVFIVKGFISHESDLVTVGVFQAAWGISNLYLGMILNAMGTDLYPRLSEVNRDSEKLSAVVDSQLTLGILIVTPLLMLLMAFAPVAIPLLYSGEFTAGVSLLRWFMLAFFLRSISWTMSYVLLSKAMSVTYITIEGLWYVLYFGVSFLLYDSYGIDAFGIGSFVAYGGYTVVLWGTMKRIGCIISSATLRLAATFSLLISLAFLLNYFCSGGVAWLLNCTLTTATFLLTFHRLRSVIDLRGVFAKIKDKFRKRGS